MRSSLAVLVLVGCGEVKTMPDAAPTSFTLTVAMDGPGSGTISSAPGGVTCPGTCSAVFDRDATVTLTATPDSGWLFGGWTGGGCTGTGACTTTVAAAETVTATFSCPPGGTQTFAFTGASASFTVPKCVTSLTVDVQGAQGSPGAGTGGPGGLGGQAQGKLAAAPDDVLTIVVGAANGYNGGGNAGLGTGPKAGVGGGRSEIQNAAGQQLVVAGGGGGGGGTRQGSCGATGVAGGAGGGDTAANGTDGGGCGSTGGVGGKGGSQVAGGGGGIGNANCSVTGGTGGGGVALLGGAGGTGASGLGCDPNGFNGAGGGGGGGGWFGGGGGGGAAGGGGGSYGSGGGGGGSTYLGGLTEATSTAGVRAGDGVVTLNW